MKYLLLILLLSCGCASMFHDPIPSAVAGEVLYTQQIRTLTCEERAVIIASLLADYYAVSIRVVEPHPYMGFLHAVVVLHDTKVGEYEIDSNPPLHEGLGRKVVREYFVVWFDAKKNVKTEAWRKKVRAQSQESAKSPTPHSN